jgi:hypothetical protein
MPSRSRMRNAYMCDISALTSLTALAELNLVGFGAADVSPLGGLVGLHTLELGLNPLDGGSLRTLGRITSLRHLELAGTPLLCVVLSSSLLACKNLVTGVSPASPLGNTLECPPCLEPSKPAKPLVLGLPL